MSRPSWGRMLTSSTIWPRLSLMTRRLPGLPGKFFLKPAPPFLPDIFVTGETQQVKVTSAAG